MAGTRGAEAQLVGLVLLVDLVSNATSHVCAVS